MSSYPEVTQPRPLATMPTHKDRLIKVAVNEILEEVLQPNFDLEHLKELLQFDFKDIYMEGYYEGYNDSWDDKQ